MPKPEALPQQILFVSRWGDSLDLAYALSREGNEIRYGIEDPDGLEIGDGFVTKTTDWRADIPWADLVVFDYTGYGEIAESLRRSGKRVFGGTQYTDRLELDRNFGQHELHRHKVKILGYQEFDSFREAIAYIERHPRAYVIKPCGETQDYKQLLFVGSDDAGADVIRMLRAYEKSWGDFGTFQLQRKVQGVEISVSAFFNGKTFLRPINVTLEHKKLFPKELGISTGEMGSAMFWVDESPIFDATLRKFESTLAREGFTGHIDLNCIVNGQGIYPLEFTSRFGYPQASIQRAGLEEPLGALLKRICEGDTRPIETRKGFQVGAYFVVPPFPYDDPKSFDLFSRDAVVVFKKSLREGLHPVHLKQVETEWLITGCTGIPLLVTGTGLTMREAQRVLYRRMAQVLINNGYYRTDIGDRWTEDSDKLWSWGLL
ncbi:MAG: phosphoribosylamine--glycine ligase [Bacteroidetes bacterium]|nr:phosphoribosylamine--glycine ligase [Bacteroidota bacterium]